MSRCQPRAADDPGRLGDHRKRGEPADLGLYPPQDRPHTRYRLARRPNRPQASARPPLLVFGLAGSAVPLVGGFRAILGLRLLQGVAGSAIASLTVTLIGDLFTGGTRDTLIGLNAAILAVGAAGHPVLGGALAAISWAVPFVGFVLGVLIAVLGASVLEEPALERGESGLSYFLDAAKAVPARTVFSLYVAIFGIFIVLYGAQLIAVPFVLDNQYQLSPGVIGVLLALPAVTMGITSSQAGRLLRHLSTVQLVPLGFVAYGIGLIGVELANSVYAIAASLLLFGLGQGLAEPITDTALNAITPDEFRGGVMSVRTSVLQAGTTVGPPLFIALATTVGYLDVLVGVGVAAFGLGTVAFVLIARHR